MDNFNGIKNEAFIKFFLDVLNSKTEFIQHSNPGEEFDPEQEYGKHIEESQEILENFILESIKAAGQNLSADQTTELIDGKKKELFKILLPEIDNYISKIKVAYK